MATSYSFYSVIVLFSNLSFMKESLPEDLKFARERLIFSINLPTTDRGRYKELHGIDHYSKVKENISRLISAGYEVKINVQSSTLTTPEDQEGVIKRYGELTPIDIVNSDSRAGLITELALPKDERTLSGCLIRRPINHIHVGIDGEIFLCCQDFFKEYKFGSLRESSLRDILTSESASKYLEYIYGEREAPTNFICRNCEFAIYKKGRERV